ncbi:MAG: hypothetical protein WBZ01_16585 [Terriglobales bacterium]|jgi:hypothetical protein
MSMKEALAEQKAKVQARLGEKFDVIAREVERIQGLGLPDRSLKVGQSAPGFALPDAYGREVSLKKAPGPGAGRGQFLSRPMVPLLRHPAA